MAVVKIQPRRGLAVIETALVFPLLLLMTLGMLEYGWMFLKSQGVTNAARQGARVGARVDATDTDVRAAVAGAMTAAGIAGEDYEITMVPVDLTTLVPGAMLTVTVKVHYGGPEGIGFNVPLIPTPHELASTVTMAREGP